MKRNLFALILSAQVFTVNALASNSIQNIETKLTIAVSSNFYYPLSSLIKQSEYWTAQPIRLVSASSGTLHAQITKGAPFDVFFSADLKRPQSLEQQSLAVSRQTYAQGKLVLWPVQNVSSPNFYTSRTIDVTRKLAIANPQLAPFGVAAKAYINTLENAKHLTENLVLGASVTQAFQFVDSGNAQIGLLAESTLIQALHTLGDSRYAQYRLIPIESYPPIIQQVVIVSRSDNKAAAQKFIDFVLSPASQQQLNTLGYIPVQESSQ